jgi:hypothetical protein
LEAAEPVSAGAVLGAAPAAGAGAGAPVRASGWFSTFLIASAPGWLIVTSFESVGLAACAGTLSGIRGRKPSIAGVPLLAACVMLGCPLKMPSA